MNKRGQALDGFAAILFVIGIMLILMDRNYIGAAVVIIFGLLRQFRILRW